MDNQEKVIEKIQKLLSLSENNPNVKEAASAAAQAQRLMYKYNISKYMLESVDENFEQEQVSEFFIADLGRNKKHWKIKLLECIADANYCKSLFVQINKPQRHFKLTTIGTQQDARVVKYMYHYLVSEVERLCKRDNLGLGKTWANNYKLGAISTIRDKLQQEKQKTTQEAKQTLKNKCLNSGISLVHVGQALKKIEDKENNVNKYFENMKTTTAKLGKARKDYNAFLQGKKAAQEIDLKSNNKLEE